MRHDINKRDALGVTALFEAVSEGSIQEIISVLDHGADPNIPDNNGTTPLMEAASGGDLKVVALLVAHRANRLLKDDFGDNAADYAFNQGFNRLSKLLNSNVWKEKSVTEPATKRSAGSRLSHTKGHGHRGRVSKIKKLVK